jgi:hypothetical protein
MPRHHLIKLLQVKDTKKTLKDAREKKQETHRGATISLTADFSAETLNLGDIDMRFSH